MLDHKIELSSEVGRGSHFSVRLPIAPALAAERAPRTPARTAAKLAGLHVLCVDNEPKVLDGMETLLTGWGCRVSKAADLEGALKLVPQKWEPVLREGTSSKDALEAAESPPLGALVDYHLDRGTGLEVIAALRARCGPDLPAILITADRDAQVREAARAANVTVLHKPLKPAALRALIGQWRMHGVAAAE